MNDVVKISRAYRILHMIAERGSAYSSAEMGELESCSTNADQGLSESLQAFERALHIAEDELRSGTDDGLVAALIRLRIHAMDASTELSNLVDSISLLFQRRAVRTTLSGDA